MRATRVLSRGPDVFKAVLLRSQGAMWAVLEFAEDRARDVIGSGHGLWTWKKGWKARDSNQWGAREKLAMSLRFGASVTGG